MPRRTGTLSSSICRDVIRELDRLFVLEGPDEPDLALNVTYITARAALLRLSSARPWVVPAPAVEAIRRALDGIDDSRDPEQLAAQLLCVPLLVLRLLERRRSVRTPDAMSPPQRRAGDVAFVTA